MQFCLPRSIPTKSSRSTAVASFRRRCVTSCRRRDQSARSQLGEFDLSGWKGPGVAAILALLGLLAAQVRYYRETQKELLQKDVTAVQSFISEQKDTRKASADQVLAMIQQLGKDMTASNSKLEKQFSKYFAELQAEVREMGKTFKEEIREVDGRVSGKIESATSDIVALMAKVSIIEGAKSEAKK